MVVMFYQGDIIEVNFDPTVGHEPAKRRPALVVSSDAFNMMSSLTFIAPITSTNNGYPLHVVIDKENDIHGCICIEQIRSLDLEARRSRKIGELSVNNMNYVLSLIGPVFGI